MSILNELLAYAAAQVGYTEKNNDRDLENMTGPTAGDGNHTKYAAALEKVGLNGYCGQPWCGVYQMALEVHTVGLEAALANLGPEYYNCFATMNWAKRNNKWIDRSGEPKPGYIVIFSQSHMARVIRVTGGRIYTNEGNTSNGTAVIRNGGMVCNKDYDRNFTKVLGYVVIEYDESEKHGWIEENNGYRFYLTPNRYVANDWYRDADGKWYWFDGAGMMVSNVWYQYHGGWYYLGSDGAMLKGLQAIDGKWYCMDQEGRMVTEPVTLTPDQDGALHYPGLAA